MQKYIIELFFKAKIQYYLKLKGLNGILHLTCVPSTVTFSSNW